MNDGVKLLGKDIATRRGQSRSRKWYAALAFCLFAVSLSANTYADDTVLTTQVPALADASDGGVSYELGMKFQSAVAGSITAVRHWKSPSETGSHVGRIWTATGTLLATVTFSNETASGWQQQALTTALSIQPNTTYVVSVNVNSYFPDTYDELATPIVNGNLSSVADGNNGVHGAAGSPGTFPTNSYRNSNYYRDIVFTTGPTITKLSGDNQSGEVNTTLGQPLVVEVRDGSGNPQAGTTVDFTVTAGGGSVAPVSAVTNANGQASTSLTLGPTAGTHTVEVTATGIGTVTFNATANPAPEPPTQLALSPATGNTVTSQTVTYQATIQDQFGNPVTGAANPVTFSVAGVTGTFSQNPVIPVNGIASVGFTPSTAGTATLTASAAELSSATATLTVTSGTAGFTITKLSGDNQSGEVNTPLGQPLVVEVRDGSNNPQAGTTVDFTVTAGGGSVAPVSAVTGANGQASTSLTLGPTAGTNTVQATATGIGTVTFNATANPAPEPPTQVALSPVNATTTVNTPVAYQATIQDQFGNPVTDATNPVTFSVAGVTGTFSPSATVMPVNGVASVQFTPTTSGTATLTAAASGLTSATTNLTVTEAQGGTTVLTTQVPALADASDGGVSYELGMKFQSAVAGSITAVRHWKSPSETGSHVGRIWTATGTLLATVTFSNETASGWQQQALTTPLSIQPNTTYVVSVNVNSYFPDTYDELATPIVNGNLSSIADGNNGVHGAAGSPGTFPTNSYRNSNYYRDIVFTTGPTITKLSGDNQSGEVNTTLGQPLVVEVRDGSNNPQAGTTVDFTVTAGGGSVAPVSAVTNANGQASTSLTLGPTAGTNTVEATATGIGTVTFNATANPAPEPPTQLASPGQRTPSRCNRSPIRPPFRISSATRSPVPPTRSPSASPGSPAPSASATVTPVNGVASVQFTPTTAGTATLTAAASGLTSATATLTVTSDTAGFTLTKVSGDNQSGAVNTTLSQPLVVAVRDSSNNPVAGTTVNFTVTAGGGSVAPASAVTNANGQASTSLTLGPKAGTHTVQATATGIGTVTFNATANPAEPPRNWRSARSTPPPR